MKEKSCGAFIYKKENGILKYLLVYQDNNTYSFPKGHVEGNETEIETALREIKEETNLDVELDTNFRICVTYFVERKKVDKDVVYFIGTPTTDDLKPQEGEIKECSWNTYDEAMSKLEYDNVKEAFKKANNYLKKVL